MKRRAFLQSAAAIPVIGLIDYSDWTENTEAGLPEALPRPFGISDLVEMPSLGPYAKFVWLDFSENPELPQVRAVATVDDRNMFDENIRVQINFGEGWNPYDVTRDVDFDTRWPRAMVTRESLMRVIRVLIREHYGYPTTYTT